MAIKQSEDIKVRRENLQTYITYGGTGECIRALLQAYNRYHDDWYKKISEKGLNFLDSKYPICVNGLRDIGLQESEAFSAISIIDAYLDAYELTKNKSYLKTAITYGMYCASFFYLYNIYDMEFMWNFHPISYSITPRLSPFEVTRIVSTFNRLAKHANDDFWKNLADYSFVEVKKWITSNGGLSEGVFPINNELKRLPMEQTFATVELMESCYQYDNKKIQYRSIKHKRQPVSCKFQREGNTLHILYNEEKVFSFNYKNWKIEYIKNSQLNDQGISLSFSKPYSMKNQIKRRIKQRIRGRIGKYLLGIFDLKYVLNGVYGPKPIQGIHHLSFTKVPKKYCSMTKEHNIASCICETFLHRLSTNITVSKNKKDLQVHFSPMVIEVLDHDVDCQQVLFPIIGCRLEKNNNGRLDFEGFSIKGFIPKIYEEQGMTAVDQTLSTNWTHGGIFQESFDFIIHNIICE
jgi:hypothetical protein